MWLAIDFEGVNLPSRGLISFKTGVHLDGGLHAYKLEGKNLVGGFNPVKNISQNGSKWESSANRGENKASLKPPPRSSFKKTFLPSSKLS